MNYELDKDHKFELTMYGNNYFVSGELYLMRLLVSVQLDVEDDV